MEAHDVHVDDYVTLIKKRKVKGGTTLQKGTVFKVQEKLLQDPSYFYGVNDYGRYLLSASDVDPA